MDINILITILLALINLLLLGFAKVLWNNYKTMETRVGKLETEIQNVKGNYLTRFEELKQMINEVIVGIKDLEIKFLNNCETKHQKLETSIFERMEKK